MKRPTPKGIFLPLASMISPHKHGHNLASCVFSALRRDNSGAFGGYVTQQEWVKLGSVCFEAEGQGIRGGDQYGDQRRADARCASPF